MNKFENMAKETKPNEEILKDLTPARAQSIFENKIINGLNKTLSEEQQVHSDEPAKLDWNLDEQTGEIVFSIVKRVPTNEQPKDEPDKYIKKINPKTGKKYIDYTLSPMEKVTSYPLETGDVKKAFNKLDQNIKETFIQGMEENLAIIKERQQKLTKAMEKEMRQDEKEQIKKQLDNFTEDYNRAKKVLEALE